MTKDGDPYPVRWSGGQAIVTLPEHVDVSNTDQIIEELLSVINRGAVELIADMTATLSCDHAGIDAVTRVYRQALVSGTHLRLVVTNQIVRRMLAVNGLDRLIPVYPFLEAATAGAGHQEAQGASRTGPITPAVPGTPGLPGPADQADPAEQLLDWVLASIFDIGVILQAPADLPHDAAGLRITQALRRLDDVVLEIRQHMFAKRIQSARSGSARRSPPQMQQRPQAGDWQASLQGRVVRTAHALQSAAADTAALLRQRADLAGQPARIDYPAEAQRWQAFADQAEQMAERWEQRP